MRRICLLIFILFMVCGCSNIEKESVDDVLAQSNTSIKNTNQYRTGYKYYLPTNMSILKSEKQIVKGRQSRYNDSINRRRSCPC